MTSFLSSFTLLHTHRATFTSKIENDQKHLLCKNSGKDFFPSTTSKIIRKILASFFVVQFKIQIITFKSFTTFSFSLLSFDTRNFKFKFEYLNSISITKIYRILMVKYNNNIFAYFQDLTSIPCEIWITLSRTLVDFAPYPRWLLLALSRFYPYLSQLYPYDSRFYPVR